MAIMHLSHKIQGESKLKLPVLRVAALVTQAVYKGGAVRHHASGIKLHIISHYSLHKPAFYSVSLLLKTSCKAKEVMKVYSSGAKQTLWRVTGKS